MALAGLLSACSSSHHESGDGGSGSGSPPVHFATASVGATVGSGLPTEAQCTAWVMAAAPGLDDTETMPCNAAYNAASAIPTATWLQSFHLDPEGDSAGQPDADWMLFQGVTGNFSGTTDMILRWAACKWGIDEDVLRAEAVEESSWQQSVAAGCGSTLCTGQGTAPPATSAANYWVAATDDPTSQTQGGTCCPTKGLLQLGYPYWYAYPYGVTSSALNADYRGAAQRACMNGDIAWLVGTDQGAGSGSEDVGTYPPTTTDTALDGCMGHWNSGSWNDSAALAYVQRLQMLTTQQAWTSVACP
jgi:hypothetical protein